MTKPGDTEAETFIESRQDVKGGAPVIKGTRLTISAIVARVNGGDSYESLIEDYSYLNAEIIDLALEYAKIHPLPKPLKPWRAGPSSAAG